MKRQTKGKQYIHQMMVAFLLCCLFLLCMGCASGSDSSKEKKKISEVDSIYAYLLASNEVDEPQMLVDQIFTKKPNSGITETFIQSMAEGDPDLEYTNYAKALEEAILSEKEVSASSLQKACITFVKLGFLNSQELAWIDQAVSMTGNDSIMSYIYGILLMNEIRDASFKEESCYGNLPDISEDMLLSVIDSLCELQLEDGGFAYQGLEGDVDVTAMTLQALAPFYGQDEFIQKSMDRAISFLASKQLEDGDFPSMGNANSESTAQVMISLIALKIDISSDQRFQKQGKSVLDGLLKYKLTSGGFCHAFSGKENAMATSQALQALTFYEKTLNANALSESESANWLKNVRVQCILTILILSVAILYGVFVAKGNRKKWISELVLVSLLLVAVWCIRLESATTHQKNMEQKMDVVSQPVSVTVSIDCHAVLGVPPKNQVTDFSSIIPENGLFLSECEVVVEKGSSVYDLLKKVCVENQISLDVTEDTLYGTYYVKGIGLLYEFDFGDLSGWMYRVNGEFPSIGAGEYELKDSDVVEWIYTKEMGKDL